MTRFPRPRKPIPDSVERQLSCYALAAGAAGVGVLSLACPAEAKIIYTPAHIQLVGPHSQYLLDVNHDGIPDFALNLFGYRSSNHFSSLNVNCNPGIRCGYTGLVLNSRGNTRLSRDLKAGFVIGAWARSQFEPDGLMASIGTSSCVASYRGLWANGGKGVTNRYLGLRFQINGKAHYGWARLNVSFVGTCHQLEATLTGYAYETIPHKRIVAGATEGPDDAEPTALNTPAATPATVGALALGAPGLSIWRREESVLASSERN